MEGGLYCVGVGKIQKNWQKQVQKEQIRRLKKQLANGPEWIYLYFYFGYISNYIFLLPFFVFINFTNHRKICFCSYVRFTLHYVGFLGFGNSETRKMSFIGHWFAVLGFSDLSFWIAGIAWALQMDLINFVWSYLVESRNWDGKWVVKNCLWEIFNFLLTKENENVLP